MKKFLKVRRNFDSAHYLNNYDGKCANLHGHTWFIESLFEVLGVHENGISEDFKKVKAAIDMALPDHAFLNEVYKDNPTAENLSEILFKEIDSRMSWSKNLKLKSANLYEGPGSSIICERGEGE